MIVKDEQDLLPGCLESLKGWADEIIVVDTGSSDKTVEIAEEAGCITRQFAWTDSFSDARNHSISLATKDWIFIIDADERMEESGVGTLLRAMSDPETELIMMGVYNIDQKDGTQYTFLRSPRAWRRSLGFKYERRVHNWVKFPDNLHIAQIEAGIGHLGYSLSPEKMFAKQERTRRLLELELADNPADLMTNYYLAQNATSYLDDFPGRWEKVIEYSQAALNLPAEGQTGVRLMCMDMTAWGYYFLKDYPNALIWAQKALAEKPDYLDPAFCLAQTLVGLNQPEDAIKAYKHYLLTADNFDPNKHMSQIILRHTSEQVHCCRSIAKLYDSLGNKFEASRWAMAVGKYEAKP